MAKSYSGLLISFEGTEGSGKSTLIQKVFTLLKESGYKALQTREPGGNDVAEKIRSILLNSPMDPWTELLLYEAARAEHTAKILRPALQEGQIVLCDRFIHSTLAYQAHARGLPWNDVKTLNRMATFGIKPHLTFFLDIDPEMGLRRAQDPNRFEAEGIQFQTRVRAGFIKAKAEEPKRWHTLKVQDRTPDQLAEIVLKQLTTRFKGYFRREKTIG